jgi:HEAT repeat protein
VKRAAARTFSRAALAALAAVACAPLVTGVASPTSALAQPSQPGRVRRPIPTPQPTVVPREREREHDSDADEQKPPEVRALRGRFGLDVADRLGRGTSTEDRLRAIARARALGGNESIGFLVDQTARVVGGDGDGAIAIELARALDAFSDNERGRSSLHELVVMPVVDASQRRPRDAVRTESFALEDPTELQRIERARTMAALALARTHEPRAFTLLADAIRANGPGAQAAKIALLAYPPEKAPFGGGSGVAYQALDFIVKSHDLRSIPQVHALVDSSDNAARSAALRALAEMGDTRALALATPLLKDDSPEVRAAATFVLVRLGAPDAEAMLVVLMRDPLTVEAAIAMSEYVQTKAMAQELASRALEVKDVDVRAPATLALGRQATELAARSLLTLVLQGTMPYESAHALARSPSPVAAGAIEALLDVNSVARVLGKPPADEKVRAMRRLGARAYLVRALARGERSVNAENLVGAMMGSTETLDRALATTIRVALSIDDAKKSLASPEAEIRRAAAMGLYARPDREARALLAARLVSDDDATMRSLGALSLTAEDEDAPKVTSTWLADRATSGGPDAPLAAYAFVRRADEKDLPKVDALLGSNDALLRAHAARGLAASSANASVGRLARLYAYEPNAQVRRAAVLSLAARKEIAAPLWTQTMHEAATLDPDGEIRFIASSALGGHAAAPSLTSDALFVRVTKPGAPSSPVTAAFVRADGLCVPFAFDREGYAVVLGIPPGPGRVLMTPLLP